MNEQKEARPVRHPDIYTADEAADYLGLASGRSLESLRESWGLRPLPLGRGLYHRDDLDAVVERAHGEQNDRRTTARPGRGTELKLHDR